MGTIFSKLFKNRLILPFVIGFFVTLLILNVFEPFDKKLSKREKELDAQHEKLVRDWSECRDEYYSLFNTSNYRISEEFQRTFNTKYLPKNQECVTKLKLLEQFLKDNEHDLLPLFEEANITLTEYINDLEVNFKDFDSKDLSLLIQNKKLAESISTCIQNMSNNITEDSKDSIASIENVNNQIFEIAVCKGRITAYEKFLTINEKELIAAFEGTGWDYYQLVSELEVMAWQLDKLDTAYNKLSEVQSQYYNS